jgi:hypothetical protein
MFARKLGAFAKCGEETSPTPQMDWSLAHGLKTAFGLNFLHRICPRFFEIVRTLENPLAAAFEHFARQLLCHN